MLSPDWDGKTPVYALPRDPPSTGLRDMSISPPPPRQAVPPPPDEEETNASKGRRARRALSWGSEDESAVQKERSAPRARARARNNDDDRWEYDRSAMLPREEQIEEFRRMKLEQDKEAQAAFDLERAAARAKLVESIKTTQQYNYGEGNSILIIAVHLSSVDGDGPFSGYWMASRPASGRALVRLDDSLFQLNLSEGALGKAHSLVPMQFAMPLAARSTQVLFSIREDTAFALQWTLVPNIASAVLPEGNEAVRSVVAVLSEDPNKLGTTPDRMRAVVFKRA